MTTPVIFKPTVLPLKQDSYLGNLLQQCEVPSAVPDKAGLWELRRKAASVVVQSAIPRKNDEEWRFTDLSDLLDISFRLAQEAKVTENTFASFVLPEATNTRLVFVNGVYAPELSNVSALPEGIYVGNLGNLPAEQREKILTYLGKQEDSQEVFTALNTAGIADVAVIWAKPNIVVETPIHLLRLTVAADTPTFSQPRALVVAERGASLNLVEYYGANVQGCSDRPQKLYYLTNTVTEIWLEENAQLNHSRIQRESGDGFHLAKSAIAQERDSHYNFIEINLGAKLYRHNLQIFQRGENTQTHLYGLTAITAKQVADTHSAVFLSKPNGTVNQLHKCVVDGSAHAIFNGKIFVPKAAQLTNASQLNRNLILSPHARVNTKPELQITADNVKCSHGATISQLEADEVFYLRSRGLTEYDARHLLLDAFVAEIIDIIPLVSLKQRLTQCVACRTID
jgi:Fe-S cluster assembly protein SufD